METGASASSHFTRIEDIEENNSWKKEREESEFEREAWLAETIARIESQGSAEGENDSSPHQPNVDTTASSNASTSQGVSLNQQASATTDVSVESDGES